MTIAQHYDEDALIALIERAGSDAVTADEHVASCPSCREAAASYFSMVECLQGAAVWQQQPPLSDAPVPATIAALRAFAARGRTQDADGEALVAELIVGGRAEWMPRAADAKYQTEGVVRKLIERAEEVSGKSPADELALSELATTLAEQLEATKYGPNAVARLRGDAWRTRAYALDYTGDLNAAMAAVTRARQQYDLLPVADYDVARLELTRALILRHLDRLDEGLEAVRTAVGPLQLAAETRRLRMARTIEAAMRRRGGDIRGALAIWLDLEPELHADDVARPGILNNIAVCYRELNEFDLALGYYREAAELAARTGALAEFQRFRWNIGSILLRQQRFADAEALLTSVIEHFVELTMREEAVLARLELTELFILQKRFAESIHICEDVVAELHASGLEHTPRAVTAVMYLQEATRAKRATAALAQSVRAFVRDSRMQPALLFAPPL